MDTNNYRINIKTEVAVQPAVSDMSTQQVTPVPPVRLRRVDIIIYKQKECLFLEVAFIVPVHFGPFPLLKNLKAI